MSERKTVNVAFLVTYDCVRRPNKTPKPGNVMADFHAIVFPPVESGTAERVAAYGRLHTIPVGFL